MIYLYLTMPTQSPLVSIQVVCIHTAVLVYHLGLTSYCHTCQFVRIPVHQATCSSRLQSTEEPRTVVQYVVHPICQPRWICSCRHHCHNSFANCVNKWDFVPPILLSYATTVALFDFNSTKVTFLSLQNACTPNIAAITSSALM